MNFDESVYRLCRREVYRFAYRHLGDHSASEDIVQDSFVRLAQYRTGTIANMGGMLRTIARNLIVDHARFRTRRSEDALAGGMDAPAEYPSQEQIMLHRERMEQVSEILAQMPAQRREVFIMRRLHGMSAKEVAAALAISPAAVDTHVARAVLALHKGMATLDEAPGQ
ncbi:MULTISPECIES: RNA polymerase sigma factor [unclassified Novosphingobium]|uniref:RNA polymerase sigma factor n=1 Tax=unclassified Novosphingobium TaxID=2644732 RepID=UPI00135B8D41|nr:MULTISPECIES: sigma-70 family RNA polymerase sigma factor [unclassified Novosphingobium]